MRRELDPERAGSDPTKVFVVIASVLVAVGSVVWLTRPDPEVASTSETALAQQTPDFSLTDEEAIARVEQLEALKIRAYRALDSSLLGDIFTTHSPSLTLVQRDFDRLRRSGLKFRSAFETEKYSVARNDDSEVVVRQTVTVSPRLVDGEGVDRSSPAREQLQVVDWILHRERDVWLVYETVIRRVRAK